MTKAFDTDLQKEVAFNADATPVITTVCCSCGDFLNIKDGKGIIGLSHTYCDECSKALLAELN